MAAGYAAAAAERKVPSVAALARTAAGRERLAAPCALSEAGLGVALEEEGEPLPAAAVAPVLVLQPSSTEGEEPRPKGSLSPREGEEAGVRARQVPGARLCRGCAIRPDAPGPTSLALWPKGWPSCTDSLSLSGQSEAAPAA